MIKLFNISKKNKIPCFINISGTATSFINENLENEYNFYLLSKKITDLHFLNEKEINNKIVLNSLRISAPYGYLLNKDSIFVNFVKNATQNKDLTIFGDGNRKQVFTFSEDVGNCCLKLIKKKKKWHILLYEQYCN